jgi:hypothetical protein
MADFGRLRGDGAKESIEEDEFGLGPMTEALASVLTRQIDLDGYVIGLTGDWGSGKSSLVNFVIERIKKIEPGHCVIKFDPWLIGKRDTLLFSFFSQLASEIEDQLKGIGPSSVLACLKWEFKYRRLANKIRVYGSYVGRASVATAPAATLDPTGTVGFWSAALAVLAAFSNLFSRRRKTLTEQRAEIRGDLTAIWNTARGTRFTIVIDDMDRLEPGEAVELLRLVSKVADFPQVTYILCIDPDVLAKQIRTELDVEDGYAYLEKVVQSFIPVPPHEPFALRRFFQSQLAKEFPNEMSYDDPSDVEFQARKNVLFDKWAGKFILTPRDVSRTLDGVKLVWPHIKGKADFFDLVWLQILRLKFPDLHGWVSLYVSEVGAYRDSGRASDGDGKTRAKSLKNLMDEVGWGKASYFSGLSYFLPGVSGFVLDGEKQRVFDFKQGEVVKFEKGQRLGSPIDWRIYFAFELPSYAIDNDAIGQFRNAVSTDYKQAIGQLDRLMKKYHPKKGHYVDTLLDRLKDEPDESFSPAEMEGLVRAFVEVMDGYAEGIGHGEAGRYDLWSKARSLVGNGSAEGFLDEIESGKSICWMTSVLRDQAHAHGRPDPNRERPDHQWLNERQLNLAIGKMIARFRNLGIGGIVNSIEPLGTLFCWVQLGSEDEVRRAVAEYAVDDGGFISVVRAMRSWLSSSSTGVSYPVRPEYLETFMDVEVAQIRLRKISESKELDADLVEEAKALLGDWGTHHL